MKVVDVEEDDAAAIERHRTFEIERGGAARCGELAFFVAAGSDLFECLDGSWLAVDTQLEVIFGQAVNKLALLVKNHHVGLDEFGVNTYNVILWFAGGGVV